VQIDTSHFEIHVHSLEAAKTFYIFRTRLEATIGRLRRAGFDISSVSEAPGLHALH
jgi:hypothetical protein